LWSLELITPPVVATPALTEGQCRAHSRIDPAVPGDDIAVKQLAAIATCEDFTGRQLATATWELWLSTWYEPGIYRPSSCGGPGVIRVPKPPLQSVTSIKYLDEDGVLTTLDAADYVVVAGSGPKAPRAEIFPAYGTTWPTSRVQPGSIQINFDAGYGDDHTTVPAELTQGMLLWFGELYERREEQTIGTITANNSIGAERLWWPVRADF
jgi:uncharacterized phiE125 gp8 family phage protein